MTGRDVKLIVIAAITFALLDTIWLGFVMRDFYRAELGPIALLSADGSSRRFGRPRCRSTHSSPSASSCSSCRAHRA